MSKYTKAVAAGNTDKSLKTSLSNHTNFAHIDDPSKTMPIDPDCIERVTVYDSTASGRLLTKSTSYNSKVVALAEQLKYQHENGNATQSLPDEFYLQYAQRLLSIQYSSKYGNVIPGIDVAPDPKYAQYSYEEIIAMANNGVNIPKEVLAWAKGQQEADVVDYIVVSDNDESSNDETNGESELNKVRSEVKAYAIKSNVDDIDFYRYSGKWDASPITKEVRAYTDKLIKNLTKKQEQILCLTMLFHDMGKAETKTGDENGIGHFYGHADVSEEIVRKRMRFMDF